MSKKGLLPSLIFVAPIGKGAQKIRHKHVVFEVVEFAEDGWPKLLRLMRDDEVVDLEARTTPPAFMTAYCQERSVGPWKGKA